MLWPAVASPARCADRLVDAVERMERRSAMASPSPRPSTGCASPRPVLRGGRRRAAWAGAPRHSRARRRGRGPRAGGSADRPPAARRRQRGVALDPGHLGPDLGALRRAREEAASVEPAEELSLAAGVLDLRGERIAQISRLLQGALEVHVPSCPVVECGRSYFRKSACTCAASPASSRICAAMRAGSGRYVPCRTAVSMDCSLAARPALAVWLACRMTWAIFSLSLVDTRSPAPLPRSAESARIGSGFVGANAW